VTVTGVDGCRGGWLAASVTADGAVTWRWTDEFADIVAGASAAIAVDIPIGLVDSGVRACDVAARRRLGRRGATVFAAPVRPVLGCATYADARRVLAAAGGPSMSAQAFGIVAAVRHVDARVSPADEDRVVEVHPELAFSTLTGGPLPSKRSSSGVTARVGALEGVVPRLDRVIAAAPPRARIDDVLDALVCAWVARRWMTGRAQVLGDGERDARGLLMRIVT
jgi:predicted RNase H-like nuclease